MTASRGLHRSKLVAFDDRYEILDRGFWTPCHEWQWNVSGTGYGRHGEGGKMWLAHRYSYTRTFGQIPEGLSIDHLCRNRRCVNPDHLEAVTPAENTRRQQEAILLKTEQGTRIRTSHCKNGHFKDGHRCCKICAVGARAKHRAKLTSEFGSTVHIGGFGTHTSAHIEKQRAERAIKANLVAKLYAEGMPTPDIAKAIGRKDRSAVFHYLKVAGVTPNRSRA